MKQKKQTLTTEAQRFVLFKTLNAVLSALCASVVNKKLTSCH